MSMRRLLASISAGLGLLHSVVVSIPLYFPRHFPMKTLACLPYTCLLATNWLICSPIWTG